MIAPSFFNIPRVSCMKTLHFVTAFRQPEIPQYGRGSRGEQQAQGQIPSSLGTEGNRAAGTLHHLLRSSFGCIPACHKGPAGCCSPPGVATPALGAPQLVSSWRLGKGNVSPTLKATVYGGIILNYCLNKTRQGKKHDKRMTI